MRKAQLTTKHREAKQEELFEVGKAHGMESAAVAALARKITGKPFYQLDANSVSRVQLVICNAAGCENPKSHFPVEELFAPALQLAGERTRCPSCQVTLLRHPTWYLMHAGDFAVCSQCRVLLRLDDALQPFMVQPLQRVPNLLLFAPGTNSDEKRAVWLMTAAGPVLSKAWG